MVVRHGVYLWRRYASDVEVARDSHARCGGVQWTLGPRSWNEQHSSLAATFTSSSRDAPLAQQPIASPPHPPHRLLSLRVSHPCLILVYKLQSTVFDAFCAPGRSIPLRDSALSTLCSLHQTHRRPTNESRPPTNTDDSLAAPSKPTSSRSFAVTRFELSDCLSLSAFETRPSVPIASRSSHHHHHHHNNNPALSSPLLLLHHLRDPLAFRTATSFAVVLERHLSGTLKEKYTP